MSSTTNRRLLGRSVPGEMVISPLNQEVEKGSLYCRVILVTSIILTQGSTT